VIGAHRGSGQPERSLDLGPYVNMPEWDATKPDYDLAVSWLLEQSGEHGAAPHPACR